MEQSHGFLLQALALAEEAFVAAEESYLSSLAVLDACLGPDHPEKATVYRNLANLQRARGRPVQGERYARTAMAIRTKALGRAHPEVATDALVLASFLSEQGKHDEAEPLVRRALMSLDGHRGCEEIDRSARSG